LPFTFVFDLVDHVVQHRRGRRRRQPVQLVIDAVLTPRQQMAVPVEND